MSSIVPTSVTEACGETRVEPSIVVHQAVELYVTQPIHYLLLRLKDSAFVWFGTEAGALRSLSVAMPVAYSTGAVSTTLMSADMEDPCPSIGQRLSAKYGMPIYLSSDLFPTQDPDIRVFAERHLSVFLKKHLAKV